MNFTVDPNPAETLRKEREKAWREDLHNRGLDMIFNQKKYINLNRKEFGFLTREQCLNFVFSGKASTPEVYFMGLTVLFVAETEH